MTTKMKEKQSAKLTLKKWVRDHIETVEQVSIPDLAAEALKVFRKDSDFLTAFVHEFLHDVVYDVARREIASTRRFIMTDDDHGITKEGVKAKVKDSTPFRNWLERVGDTHMNLMSMTREHLLVAADERDARGVHELKLARTWRKLADGLDAEQRVSEKYTEEEIGKIFDGME